MYRTLAPDKIIETLMRLHARITGSFPGSGLSKVCAELVEIARQTDQRSREIARPNRLLQAAVAALLAGGAGLLAVVSTGLAKSLKTNDDLYSTLQGIDAGFNILVLMGAALYFLISLEVRMKRSRALKALHEVRSIVHVIDMHQLTKDPYEDPPSGSGSNATRRALSDYQLVRYLDYCTEMLSLTAKVAVLYAQSFPDPVVTEVVNDIERTATGLSQKIWQKISIEQATTQRQQSIRASWSGIE